MNDNLQYAAGEFEAALKDFRHRCDEEPEALDFLDSLDHMLDEGDLYDAAHALSQWLYNTNTGMQGKYIPEGMDGERLVAAVDRLEIELAYLLD